DTPWAAPGAQARERAPEPGPGQRPPEAAELVQALAPGRPRLAREREPAPGGQWRLAASHSRRAGRARSLKRAPVERASCARLGLPRRQFVRGSIARERTRRDSSLQ